jgi:uncharacterized protein (TIGR01777 family)
MRIVIAGGTGFLGTPLAAGLTRHGHDVVILTRRTGHLPAALVTWNPDGTAGAWAAALEQADAVVNLAGASVGGRRWTEAWKRELRDSRLLATRSLVAGLQAVPARPRVFVSASGIGYYGPRGEEEVAEGEPPGDDFLARMGIEWEAEAARAGDSGARLVILRTGLVLAPDGGSLGRMLLPFRLGIGGSFGSGRQYVPWIHRRDWIDLVRWSLVSQAVHGTLNATSPQPVTNREFTRTLARVLRRPAVLPVPPFALRLVLGELADSVLTGQRAVPRRALTLGFHFRFPELEPALRDLLIRTRAIG